MVDKTKVKFEKYDIEFNDSDFEGMTLEELQECQEIIKDIKKLLE